MDGTEQDYDYASSLVQEAIDNVQKTINEELHKRVEEVCKRYEFIVQEQNRVIEGLKAAIAQSAKDFKSLQEKTNGNA